MNRVGINLLFINPNLAGGSVTYAKRLLESISYLDNQIEYFIYINKDSNPSDFQLGKNFIVRILPFSYTSVYKRYCWEQFILPFYLFKDKVDLIHSLGYVTPLFAFKKNIVSILDINYIGHGSNMNFLKRITFGLMVTVSAWMSNKIITISKFSKREIIKYTGVKSNKIIVTYLSGSIDEYIFKKIDDVSFLSKYNIFNDYIIAFSSPSPHKNILNLLKAYKIIKANYKDLKLVLVGHQNKSNILIEYINSQNFHNEIIFTGYVPDAEINPLIANAKVFVFPSRYEGFGIPILDAQMCKVPIASSNSGSLPEVGGDGVSYFDPENIYEIADTIIIAMNKKNEVNIQNKNLENRLLFSWKKAADETLDVYKFLLK